jgi:citrate synthase
LPKAPNGEEPLPEAIFWLLLTGEVPTQKQVDSLSRDLARRAEQAPLSQELINVMNNLPKDLHPMSQFSLGILLLQNRSKFFKAYHDASLLKDQYWDPCFEDVCDIIALIPTLASLIYRNLTGRQAVVAPGVNDWAGRFANLMGYSDPNFLDLLRLYMCIHADHEGGNVSAHTVHLVGSALSDPYLCLAAGLNGLAGPLHGLANQEVLAWLFQLTSKIGTNPTDEEVEDFLWDTLKAGQVIPGYGHAVLRKTDPRYTCQREFAMKHFPDDPLVRLTAQLYELVPKVLGRQGKVKNPWPNVDAHSGVLLQVRLIVRYCLC